MFDRSRLDRYLHLDPQSIYNHFSGHDAGVDPYATFAKLRAEAPVVHRDIHATLGIETDIGATIAAPGYRDVPLDRRYSAVTFEAVSQVLRDDSYDSSAILKAHQPSLGRTLISMDGTEHRAQRTIVAEPFTRRALEGWTLEIVTETAGEAAEQLVRLAQQSSGEVDLLKSFAWDYPARVMGKILGLDEEDARVFKYAALAMATFAQPGLAVPAGQVVHDWIGHLSSEIRDRPPNPSLLSKLVHAEVDGQRLTSEQISSFVRLLFVGGFETTVKGLSNVLVGLLLTGQWELVRDNPSLLARAVDEGLRWETPTLGLPRVSTRDQSLYGQSIPEGAVVLCFLASANRDESRWVDAARYDLTRPPRPHATFGFGPHICIGMHLARTEIASAISALLQVAPQIRPAPGAEEMMAVRGLASRGPTRIPVELQV